MFVNVIVNAHLAVVLNGDDAEQVSTDIGGPENAVDGDVGTSSCTQNTAGQPWWNIDLGASYEVGSVTITFPDQGGDICNYRRSCFNIIH